MKKDNKVKEVNKCFDIEEDSVESDQIHIQTNQNQLFSENIL